MLSGGYLLIPVLKGRITGKNIYKEILAKHVHPMPQTLFSAGYGSLQVNNAPIYACAVLVQSQINKIEVESKYLLWLKKACEFNVIEA